MEKLNLKKMSPHSPHIDVSATADYVNLLDLADYKVRSPTSPTVLLHQQHPEIISRSKDTIIKTGGTILLCCRVRNFENSQISWRKTEPNPMAVTQSAKINIAVSNSGEARLTIHQATMSDSGLYVCAVSNRFGTTQCTIGVTVMSSQMDVLSETNIEVLTPTSVRLNWDSLNSYIVEYCQIGTMHWRRLHDDKPVYSKYIVGGLVAGDSYTFRLVCPNTGVASLPSTAVTMPISETHLWQQQQFSNRYKPMSELGRGRFAIIRLASDLITGQRVALKQISRRHQDLGTTQEEYKLVSSAHHPNIVRGLAFYENAPTPGADTIVMEL